MYPYSKPLQNLLELGEFSSDEWLNYSIYGIDSSHKNELLKMLQDEDLYFETDSHQEWAPLHALYALYPLAEQDQSVVISLLQVIREQGDEDDGLWTYMEPVILKLGEKSFEPLVIAFSQSDTSLCSQEYFASAMAQLAEKHPEYRDQTIQVICKAMDNTAIDDPMYNALLLGHLCSLKATEAIESIRAAFERDAIDCSFMGDVEDVEIELGLREERETPRRDYLGEKFPGLKELREKLSGFSDEEKLEIISGMMAAGEGDTSEDYDEYWEPSQEPLIKGPKVGRNDPCPCGSGKKFKKCCLN